MDLKSLLNKEQYEGATTINGQVLILAGAGSGKTRVLTYRIAHMIQDLEVQPYKILAITFTNKAAKEMRDRVKSLIGDGADDMWISTFHSTCVRILRREIKHLGYNSNFTIYDSSDQKTLVTECMKSLNINDKDINAREIINKISRAKDKMQTAESYKREFESNFRENKIADVYLMYQKKLKENNAMDFDDLITKTVELFKKNPDVLEFYQRKFQYIMVDEYQDTNGAQYEFIKLLAAKYKNLCVVGDDDQCLTEDTKIYDSNGKCVKIKDIKQGDKIKAAFGNGETAFKEVSEISKKEYSGDIIKIITKSNKVIRGTANHISFAESHIKDGFFYVYLMYKKNLGYSIGKTLPVRSSKENKTNIIKSILNEQKADKLWIIKVCKDKETASFYEEYFSIKYGIPKCNLNLITRNQELINKMFLEVDTISNAEKLMDAANLFKEYPHYRNFAANKGNSLEKIINLSFFGGKNNNNKININFAEEDAMQKYKDAGFSLRDSKKNNFILETEIEKYEEAEKFALNIQKELDEAEIVRKAKLTRDNNINFMPLGSIREGMKVPVLCNEEIILDEVIRVEKVYYEGFLYDLNIDEVRNYIADDYVVHNCIYAWRGADVSNILDFEKDYPDAKVIKLEQNYRSKDNILQAANTVIKHNANRKSKALRTDQEPGEKIKIYRAFDDKSEGDFVSKEIADLKLKENKKYGDFSILYRTNAQSRIFEESLRRRGIPYKIVGGTRFYDRKEIKDILCYLKLILNPQDDISLKRIINVPKRSIGNATVTKVQDFAEEYGINIWDALTESKSIRTLTARNISTLNKFTELMDNFMSIADTIPVSNLIQTILEDTGYLNELEHSDDIEDKSRIENLKELVSDAVDFEKTSEDKSLSAYLEKVSLVQDTDKLEDEEDEEGYVVLMTVHSAKGLEFPVVFMVGMEDGLFPSLTDLQSENQMEEARRLCYVAITRAKEKLYITSAEVRRVYGRTVSYSQSEFISEISSELKDYINERSISNKTSQSGFGFNFSNSRTKESVRNSFAYNTNLNNKPSKDSEDILTAENAVMGKKVKHDKFGIGTIVSVIPSGNDKKLTIAFDKQGVKTLMLSFAKLKLV